MAGRYRVGSKEDRTADNIVFHSVHEKNCYVNQFRPLMRAGIKVELQKPFPLHTWDPIGCRVQVAKIVIDFVVTEADGTVRCYDPKGVQTAVYRIKKKWFEAEYGIRIVEL